MNRWYYIDGIVTMPIKNIGTEIKVNIYNYVQPLKGLKTDTRFYQRQLSLNQSLNSDRDSKSIENLFVWYNVYS